MTTATMHVAKTNLSRLIAQAEAGEEVIITRGAEPVARLVAIGREPMPRRRFGALAGQIEVTAAFFEPLPDAELASWPE